MEWLTAILDEDERVARYASNRDASWQIEDVPVKWGEDYDPDILAGGKPILRGSEYTGMANLHVVRHDPAAVLADIAAKREVIEICAHYIETEGPSGSQRAGVCDDILRALASAYRHAPGWDEAWGPT
jgi:hypothetical protein